MRNLTNSEYRCVNGANFDKIQPNTRIFTNEGGIDAYLALSDYASKHYNSANMSFLNSLPAGFVNDISELYYRTVSIEDRVYLYGAAFASGCAIFALGLAIGHYTI